QLHVIEKQIEEIVDLANGQLHLAADEGESHAELEQELPDVGDEIVLGHTLVGFASDGEEVEGVWILERLLGEVGLRTGQSSHEVGGGLALAYVGPLRDLGLQGRAAPAVFFGAVGVPEPVFGAPEFLEQQNV